VRESRESIGGDIGADDGEVATVELPDIRTAVEGVGLGTVGVRIGAESVFEHGGI
jgi:hypothetical protein